MLPSLEDQALRTVANKGTKELCKAAYESGVGDYLVAARKSWMTIAVSNS